MKRVVVVTYESGDIIPTQVAEGITDEEIYEYFQIGRVFNVGCVTDRLSAIKKVKILKREEIKWNLKLWPKNKT
jgi:hypothetical protein